MFDFLSRLRTGTLLLVVANVCWYSPTLTGNDAITALQLTKLVDSETVDELVWQQATQLANAIGADEELRPIAQQSLALLEIRRHQYSHAWKLLNDAFSSSKKTSPTIQTGRDRILLWLLLEGSSMENAEVFLKQTVISALQPDLPSVDRHDLFSYLGRVIGMLQVRDIPNGISPITLEKADSALRAFASTSAVTYYVQAYDDSKNWHRDLNQQLERWNNIDSVQREADIQSLMTQIKSMTTKTESAKDDSSNAKKDKQQMDADFKKLKAALNRVESAAKQPTAGRPREPTQPLAKKPSRPPQAYRVDPKTGERTYDVEKNARLEAEYRQAMEIYEMQVTQYQKSMSIFQVAMAQWEKVDQARRLQLAAEAKSTQAAIATMQTEVDSLQEAMKEKLSQVREIDQQRFNLLKLLSLAVVADRVLKEDPAPESSLIRPSNFEILDYASEASRLEREVRSASR